MSIFENSIQGFQENIYTGTGAIGVYLCDSANPFNSADFPNANAIEIQFTQKNGENPVINSINGLTDISLYLPTGSIQAGQAIKGNYDSLTMTSGVAFVVLKETELPASQETNTDAFIFTVRASASNHVFTLPTPSSGNAFHIDWGDGTSESITTPSPTHTYQAVGDYEISIRGFLPFFSFNNAGSKDDVIKLIQFGDTGILSINGFMYGCSNLESVNLNGGKAPADCGFAFRDCTSLTDIQMNEFDMSDATSATQFLLGCTSLTEVYCPDWDVSNLRDSSWFCFNCSNLVRANLRNWNLRSCTLASWMFRACTSLTDLNVSNWKTPVLRVCQGFINGSTSLVELDLRSWDVSSLTDVWTFAEDCASLVTLRIEDWQFRSPITVSRFIDNCDSLVELDVSRWSVQTVTNFGGFARNSANLTTLDTSNWFTTSPIAAEFARGCPALTSTINPNAFWLNTGITTFTNAFTASTNIANFADIPNNWKGL